MDTVHPGWQFVRPLAMPEPDPTAFGRIIKERRLALGLSQVKLAQRVGHLNHTYISRIESGDRSPQRIGTALALAQALEMNDADTLALLWAAVATEEAA